MNVQSRILMTIVTLLSAAAWGGSSSNQPGPEKNNAKTVSGQTVKMPADAITVSGDSEIAKKKGFQFVLADESNGRVQVLDLLHLEKSFWIPVPKPVWDLQRVGDGLYRSVYHGGFTVVDLRKRKIVDQFKSPLLKYASSVNDLPTGGFIASVNPPRTQAVDILEFGPDRKMIRKVRFGGIYQCRAVLRLASGDLIMTHRHGFLLGRLPKTGDKGIVLGRGRQTVGKNMFQVVQDPKDGSFWAGSGYGRQLLHFSARLKLLSAWQVAPEKNKKTYFLAQPYLLDNGHVLVCNWGGHKKFDSKNGWQLLEFNEKGDVVWKLYYPERLGSISGVDLISPIN